MSVRKKRGTICTIFLQLYWVYSRQCLVRIWHIEALQNNFPMLFCKTISQLIIKTWKILKTCHQKFQNAKNYAIFLNETEVCDTTDGMRISLGDIFVVAERVRLKPADQPWWKPKWKVFSKKNLQSKNSPGYFQHTCVFSFQVRARHWTVWMKIWCEH